MKNLLLSSGLVLLLFACKLGHYNKLIPVNATKESPALKTIFGEHFHSFLFKTNLTIYGKDFSGLLMTKQMQPRDYRVIFTTELGMKLFDFEFTDTSFNLHYCVPQFNRPALLKVIQQDIQILLMAYPLSTPVETYTDKEHQYSISKVNQKEAYTNYYFNEMTSLHLVKIEHARKNIKKTTFVLDQYLEDFPGQIRIQHHDIKLNITLTHLKQ